MRSGRVSGRTAARGRRRAHRVAIGGLGPLDPPIGAGVSDGGDVLKKTRFAEAMERAPYQTKVTDLDVIVERMQQVDEGFLGTFTAFLWERGRRAVTSVELRQRPQESYARLAWRAGKAYDASSLSFSDDWWEKATPVDWSPEQKQRYLLAVWDEVLTGTDSIWARALAARAADA